MHAPIYTADSHKRRLNDTLKQGENRNVFGLSGTICSPLMKIQGSNDSWCGFQRDVAKITSTYTRKNPLPKAVATAIFPVFEALAVEELLSGCFHGGTQNQYEAFNAMH